MGLPKNGFSGLDHSRPRRSDNEIRELLGLPPLTPEQQAQRAQRQKDADEKAYKLSDAYRYKLVRDKEIAEDVATAGKRTYREPTVNNIPIAGWYFGSVFGCQGVSKSLPESQGVTYGWTGRFAPNQVSNFYVSARSPRQECKIMMTYFIRCGATDFIKIGKTNRIETRLEDLQVANPHPLELLLCLPSIMGFREEDMHHRFAAHRQRGEWFLYIADLKEFVESKRKLRVTPRDMSLRPTPEDLDLAGCGDPLLRGAND